jgi:hypothetical protein
LEGKMKRRLAVTAFVLLAALGTRVDAGPLPKPTSFVERHQSSHVTHYVRGARQKLPVAIGLESSDRHRTVRHTHAVRGK